MTRRLLFPALIAGTFSLATIANANKRTPPHVLGHGEGLFKVGKLIAEDSFSTREARRPPRGNDRGTKRDTRLLRPWPWVHNLVQEKAQHEDHDHLRCPLPKHVPLSRRNPPARHQQLLASQRSSRSRTRAL